MAAGFALALVLNLIMGIQMYVYWGKGSGIGVVVGHEKARDEFPLGGMKEISGYGREKVDIVVQPQSPSSHPPAHQHSQSPAYGRKWARKVD
jgi:mannose-P-dolichol utilization defect protein 1